MKTKRLSAKEKREAIDQAKQEIELTNFIEEVCETPDDEGIDNIPYYEINPKKPLKITQDVIKHVRKLAGLGLTISQIYGYYGVSNVNWAKLRKKYPILELAMQQGRSANLGYVAGKLRKKIEEENLGAIIFYLKTQGGWREKEYNGEGGKGDGDNTPKIPAITLTINDPIEAAKMYQQIMLGS